MFDDNTIRYYHVGGSFLNHTVPLKFCLYDLNICSQAWARQRLLLGLNRDAEGEKSRASRLKHPDNLKVCFSHQSHELTFVSLSILNYWPLSARSSLRGVTNSTGINAVFCTFTFKGCRRKTQRSRLNRQEDVTCREVLKIHLTWCRETSRTSAWSAPLVDVYVWGESRTN